MKSFKLYTFYLVSIPSTSLDRIYVNKRQFDILVQLCESNSYILNVHSLLRSSSSSSSSEDIASFEQFCSSYNI